MLVLNDPAAVKISGDTAAAAPVANLSAFASSNDMVVKVCFMSGGLCGVWLLCCLRMRAF